jgi:RNA polymerase sigma factor for flagellar operon FliA
VADASQIDPSEAASRHELAAIILQRLEQLPKMQKKVLALYYFEDLRLREIAEAMGVTESRICQIHAQAILSIKSFLRRHEESFT